MPKAPRIVVSLLTDQQEFQLMQAADARQAAARNRLDIEVVFADNNPVLQIHQLFKYVHAPKEERPVAIVAESVTVNGLERVADSAAQVGIGWVLTSSDASYFAALKKAHPTALVASVEVEEMEIGRIQARHVNALIPGGGNILCVEGPGSSAPAIGRRAGLTEGIRGSKLRITKVLTADWTEAQAKRVVSSWLSLKVNEDLRPKVVAAQNDAMAVGARAAILALRPTWSDVRFIGCDGLPDGGQRLVKEGLLAATIIKPTTAGTGVELVGRYLRGEQVAPQTTLSPQSYPALDKLGARRP